MTDYERWVQQMINNIASEEKKKSMRIFINNAQLMKR